MCVLGLTHKTSIEEQTKDMKDQDNVHLRVDGYNSLADGIIDAIKKVHKRKDAASTSVSAGGNPHKTNWRGFDATIGKYHELCNEVQQPQSWSSTVHHHDALWTKVNVR